jgi:outer membrane receptor for ferrienterochelin and colicin
MKINGIGNPFSIITRFGLVIAIVVSFLVNVTVAQVEQSEIPQGGEEKQPQEPAEAQSEEPLLLEEITVTGARIEKELFSTPVGMNVVDQRKLLHEQPRAAAEALRDEPGIWVQKTGHIGGGPIIRGLMGKQILLLVDGVRYNNLNSFSGPNSWMNTVDATEIERVEVIRGPGSVLYGTDALGGVINVITKKHRQFTEKFQIRPKLSTRYGSVDQSSMGRLELLGSSSRFNFLLSGDLKNIEDLRGGRGIGLQTPSSWKEGNFDLGGTVKLSERHFLDLAYQDFHSYDVTRFDRPSWLSTNDREMLSLAYRGSNLNPLLPQVKAEIAFHNREDGRKDKEQLDTSFGDTETFQTEVQATSLLGGIQRLTYGVHFHHDAAEGWQETKDGRSVTPNAKWDNFGIFLQDEISLLGNCSPLPLGEGPGVRASLRHGHSNHSAF